MQRKNCYNLDNFLYCYFNNSNNSDCIWSLFGYTISSLGMAITDYYTNSFPHHNIYFLENDASIEKQKNTALNHVALYRTCLWLSVFYLIAIFSLLITQSFTEEFERSPREGFKISSIGLAFIQTLVIGVLTKFFVSTPNKNVR